jgi:ATP-dependent protease ClpP protease subunit
VNKRVNFFGEIGFDIDANSFLSDISGASSGDVVTLVIHSPGGSVFEGNTIYNIIKNSEARFEAEIIGLCASMATVIASACDSVKMSDNALFMIHAPMSGSFGNAAEKSDEIEVLRKLEEGMLRAFASKTGQDVDDLRRKYISDGKDHWLTAEEALSEGFVDEVLESANITGFSDLDFVTKVEVFNNFTMNNKKEFEAKISEFETKVETLEAKATKATEEAETLRLKVSNLVDDLESLLVTVAKLKGFDDDKIELLKLSASTDIEKAKTIVINAEAKVEKKTTSSPVAALVAAAKNTKAPDVDPRAKWSFAEWSKNDPEGLAEMKEANPERFEELISEYI